MPTIDPEACPLPPLGVLAPEIVLDSDQSVASVALCVDGEAPIAIVFAACWWIADRESVDTVVAFPGNDVPSWSAQITRPQHGDPALAIYHGVVDNEPGASYAASGAGHLNPEVADGGLSGAVRFEALERTDQNPVPNVAPTISGLVRWACDKAPEPVPGESTGWVALSVDGRAEPIPRLEAMCKWVRFDDSAVLLFLSTEAFQIDGLDVGVAINRTGLGAHEVPEVFVTLSHPVEGAIDWTGRWRYPLNLSDDQSSGTLRIRGFTLERGSSGDPLSTSSAGLVSWSCDPPLADPPAPPDGYEPHEAPLTVTGSGILRLGHPLDDDLPADVTCVSVRGEIRELSVEATYRGERVIYTAIWNESTLLRFDRNGEPLGDYASTLGLNWHGGVGPDGRRIALGTFVLERTDPRFVPLGGVGGPEQLALTITVDCPAA